MKSFLKKIISRKFIITAVIVVAGLGAAFKGADNEKIQIAGYIMAGVAAIAYTVIEGTVDKASVQSTATELMQGIETIEEDK